MESRIGRSLAVSRVYSLWDDSQPVYAVSSNLAAGRLPLLSIRPQLRDGTKIPWASIAAGTYDSDIIRQADQLKAIGKPILLAFHHEPNLATGYGTAADFRAAYQHYVTVVRGEDATNVAFAVVLTPNATPADWYPGDAYVDWVGADVYNFGACTASRPAWTSLADLAQKFYTWASATGKPIVFAEWGVPEDPSAPDRRADWINDAATTLSGWPDVRAVIYFDEQGSCDWRLTGSDSAVQAFAALGHLPLANGRPTAGLAPDSSLGVAPLTVNLDLSRNTGAHFATGCGVDHWKLYFGDGSSTSGTGNPPTIAHTYVAGTWTVSLSITDSGGRTATTSTVIISAAPPSVNAGSPTARTADTATVPAWIQTNSLTGSYYMEWGTTSAYGQQTDVVTLPGKSFQQSVTAVLTGLTPGVLYHWRGVATTAAGTQAGVDKTFRL